MTEADRLTENQRERERAGGIDRVRDWRREIQ